LLGVGAQRRAQVLHRRSNRRRLGARGVEVVEPRALEQRLLLDHAAVAARGEQRLHALHRFAARIVHLHDELPDLRPVLVGDPLHDRELALFRVDLEQVDALETLLADQIRHACQAAFVRGAPQAVRGQRGDVFLGRRMRAQRAAHHGLDRAAVVGLVGMEAGEHRGFLVEGEARRARARGYAGVDGVRAAAVGLAVGP
jgi:hypothetical protein